MATTKQIVTKAGSIAKNTAQKTGEFVKNNPKTALTIVLGIATVVIVYKLVKGVSNGVNSVFEGDKNIDNSVDVTLSDLRIDPKKLKIGEEQAKIYAQQLLDAMNAKKPIYGTDTKTISAVFDKIVPEDFKLIFHVFGEKDYNGYNSPPTGFWSNLDSYEKRNLVYWLKQELDAWLDAKVYNKVKAIVNQAGFAF